DSDMTWPFLRAVAPATGGEPDSSATGGNGRAARAPSGHDPFRLHPHDRTVRPQGTRALRRGRRESGIRLRGGPRPLLPVAVLSGALAVRVERPRRCCAPVSTRGTAHRPV